MLENTKIILSSPPDREDLVAEIYYKGQGWALVTSEGGSLIVEIYPSLTGQPLKLGLDEAMGALLEARRRLQQT
jgi:hypothetical protein